MNTEHRADHGVREAVSEALGRPVARLPDVSREPLEYDAFLAHRAVSRLRGSAIVDGERIPWSMIEKRTEGPGLASPYLLDNGRRESAAYSSGVLDDIAPGIRAPRAYGTLLGPHGEITLWLEEVHHDGCRPLGGRSILAASRNLGGLGGRWFGRELGEPWYFAGWITRHGPPPPRSGRSGARDIDVEEIRRGFDAAIALRWKLAVDVVASLERGEAPRRGSLPDEEPATAMEELLLLVDFLLATAGRVLG